MSRLTMGLDNPPGYQYLNYVLLDKIHLNLVWFTQRAKGITVLHFARFNKASSYICISLKELPVKKPADADATTTNRKEMT